MRVLIFDTETTGLPKSKNLTPESIHLWPYIVQFSYIIFDTTTNSIIRISDSIVKLKPYNVISKESTALHGITNDISLAEGIELAKIFKIFFEDVKNVDLLVAHNMSFDISMITAELIRLIKGINDTANETTILTSNPNTNIHIYKDYFNTVSTMNNLFCTMQESIQLCNIESKDRAGKTFIKFPKLIELYQKLFNQTPNHLHNSLNDVVVTLRCFIKLKFDKDIIEYNSDVEKMITDLL